jgi:hypothetical protein
MVAKESHVFQIREEAEAKVKEAQAEVARFLEHFFLSDLTRLTEAFSLDKQRISAQHIHNNRIANEDNQATIRSLRDVCEHPSVDNSSRKIQV